MVGRRKAKDLCVRFEPNGRRTHRGVLEGPDPVVEQTFTLCLPKLKPEIPGMLPGGCSSISGRPRNRDSSDLGERNGKGGGPGGASGPRGPPALQAMSIAVDPAIYIAATSAKRNEKLSCLF